MDEPSKIKIDKDGYIFYEDADWCYLLGYCGDDAAITLPTNYNGKPYEIYHNAFTYSPITDITIPEGVTNIDNYAFYGCQELALTSLPNSLERIYGYAFKGCYNLAITSLPDSLTSINSYAFSECENITMISGNCAITTLDSYSFNGTSSHPMKLTSASFPNMALTNNLSYVFGSQTADNACQQLEFCDIGSTTGIGTNAFCNCYKLQTLVLRKTSAVCTLSNVSAFTNTPMRGYNSLTGTVYVPSDLISSYQTATNWSTLYNAGTITFAAIEGSEYEL